MGESFKMLQKKPKRIAIYVIFDKDGILDGYRKYYLQELRKDVDYIVGVVSGTLSPESREELTTLTDEFFVRENKGLLAGSWIDGINYIGWDKLYSFDELLMLNDSFFGPFYPLKDMFEHMESSDADFYGAIQNFENKDFTKMGGRSLKHGYFRGSICYFYIIRSRLLHSPEFKNYWSSTPSIKEDWDTYFFAEIDFYDFVVDSGFRVSSYQSDRFKKYTFDNLTQNMYGLIKDEKIPFARIRPFASDIKLQSMQISYGKDPRQALEYIDQHTDYDVNLIWDYILRTKNLTHIYNQLQLEYVIPKHSLEKNYVYNKKIAVILHIYYIDCVEELLKYCLNFPVNTDFYITTTTEETAAQINEKFNTAKLSYECKIRPNVGVAMSSLWVTYSDVVTSGKYEYICYFHDKKSPYSKYSIQGEEFALRCYENLIGTEHVIKNIINLFEDKSRLGMLGAPVVYHGDYYSVALRSWKGNYENTVEVAKRLNIKSDISPFETPVAPYGDMFWFRATALKKAISVNFSYNDFDVKYKPDFTFMHALERIYGFAVQDSGYYYADVINSDEARTDLINYQYMVHQFCSIMLQNGYHPYNYVVAEDIIHQLGRSTPTNLPNSDWKRLNFKRKIKMRCPPKLWNFLKNFYHFFGGKKWVG